MAQLVELIISRRVKQIYVLYKIVGRVKKELYILTIYDTTLTFDDPEEGSSLKHFGK